MENNNRELDNRTNNVQGSLSYLSIFFAPVLFPLIVWIVGEKPASTHSRNALFNHILSWLFIVVSLICFAMAPAFYDSNTTLMVLLFILATILIIGSGILFIINIVRGVQLLIN